MDNTKQTMTPYQTIDSAISRFSYPILISLLLSSLWVVFFATISKATLAYALSFITVGILGTALLSKLAHHDEKKEGNPEDYSTFRNITRNMTYVLSALLILFCIQKSGMTDKPITNLNGIYLNQKIDEKQLTSLGLKKIEDSSYVGYYVYHDPSVPDAEYHIKTDYLTDIIHAVSITIESPTQDDSEALYENTIAALDAQYGGGNQGYKKRFYGENELQVHHYWEAIWITIKDTTESERLESRMDKLKEHKLSQLSFR